MSETPLLLEFRSAEQVAHLRLNQPENLNAMDLAMAGAFRRVTETLHNHRALRAVVISGEGRSFSAGGDFAMLQAKAKKTPEQNRLEMLEFYRSFLGLRDLNVPLICALHGHTVGAGLGFAAACDLRLGATELALAAPFLRLGLAPGMGGSHTLPTAFGEARARDLILSGRRMGAEEAQLCGFVCRVVGKAELLEATFQKCSEVLANGPYAIGRYLKNQREAERESLESALELEAQSQADCYAQAEFLEGLASLQERRAASW